jgi:alcohol dehydrogenase YqhD (iron-dependent ADH family)
VRKFELYNPIRMIFGPGEFSRLGELASAYGSKPLVVAGQNHAKESGLLDKAVKQLKKAGMEAVVFQGIEPNPHLGSCRKGAETARENDCDMVIGIGGGSVMDASKALAFGFYDPDDMWRRIAHFLPDFEPPDKALPIVLVSTLAATGSEGDGGAVITNEETKEKLGVFAECLFPKVSIIDPDLTKTVPMDYTLDGAIDMSVHVLEGYFNGDPWATFSDRATEGFFIEVMMALERLLAKPEDMKARSQLSYLGAIALTGFLNRPRGGDFPLHMLQHPLSGHFDISHGRGLALLLPRWLKYVSHEKSNKIVQFGERCFGMDLETHHPYEAADLAIKRLSEWLDEIGAYYFLDNLGIPNDPEMLRTLAEECIRQYADDDGTIGGIKKLGVDDVLAIYESCVRRGAPKEKVEKKETTDEELEGEEEIEAPDSAVEPEAADGEVEVIIVEEIIEVGEGEELPEGVEGEDYVVVEEIVEEIVEEEPGEKPE